MIVYILLCDNSKFYTGITNNFKRRWYEHLSSKKGYTSRFKKKEVIFLYEVESRKRARELEVSIKKTGAKRFLLKHFKILKDSVNTKLLNKKLLHSHLKT